MKPEDEDETGSYRAASSGGERIWLHPSELGSLLPTPPGAEPTVPPPIRRFPPVRRRSRLGAVAVPVVSGMIGASLTVGALAAAGTFERPSPDRVVERVSKLPVYNLAEPDGASDAASAVAPSIVALRATSPAGQRLGSGVVFRSDGHVLTNHHLVEGATGIEVTAADGRSYPARHTGSDPQSDLAVLAIENVTMEAAVMGSASALHVGQMAVVVGAPSSSLGSPSVTAGVIAAMGDTVEIDGRPFYDVISTDAMIGPRASGGPLVDRRGTVVGITTRVAPETQWGLDRLGLVIPIDRARRMADQIIAQGRVAHAWLGIECADLDPGTAREFGTGKGTLVRQVAPGGPAARGGVELQDVVTAVDAAPISSMHELMTFVNRRVPGDRIDLTVVRAGLTQRLKVRLTEAPAASTSTTTATRSTSVSTKG